jgi:hypothetical protein
MGKSNKQKAMSKMGPMVMDSPVVDNKRTSLHIRLERKMVNGTEEVVATVEPSYDTPTAVGQKQPLSQDFTDGDALKAYLGGEIDKAFGKLLEKKDAGKNTKKA